MAGLTVYWTLTAKRQRDHVFAYWTERNKSTSYSMKLGIAIKERTALLRQFPGMGVATDFRDVRAVSMGHYTLLYKLAEPRIIIVGFWDNRQDPGVLLRHILSNQ